MEYNQDNLLKLYAENLSYSEIAKQLNTTPGSISGRLGRLKKKNPELVPQRRIGVHPQGKTFGRAKLVMKPNKNTIVFVRQGKQNMTKSEMRDMLRMAVENTK